MMQKQSGSLAPMALGRVEQRLMISISAYQSHEPVRQSCAKHHLQGVWGAARHPSGEREGRSPLAFAKQCSTTARSDKHRLQGVLGAGSAGYPLGGGERDGYSLGVEPPRIPGQYVTSVGGRLAADKEIVRPIFAGRGLVDPA